MFKLIGLLGITLALGLVGVMKAHELKLRQELLEEYMKLLLALKSRINYFREPLSKGFLGDGENEARKAFLMANDIFCELDEKKCGIEEIWAKKVEESYRNTPLTAKDRECMAYVGSFIGQTDYENQLYSFDYTEQLLTAQIKEAGDVYAAKAPLYRRLGFFVGGLISVILI